MSSSARRISGPFLPLGGPHAHQAGAEMEALSGPGKEVGPMHTALGQWVRLGEQVGFLSISWVGSLGRPGPSRSAL